MVSAQVAEVIDSALRSTLSAWGYAGCDVDARPDHYGDPALFIKAHFDPPAPLPSSRATADAMVALSQKLREIGDERFPFLDYDYPEELPADDEAA